MTREDRMNAILIGLANTVNRS